MKRTWRVLALVGAGALVIGVAVALAGVPHLSAATGDVSAGTTCTKKCTTGTTGGAATLGKAADGLAAAAGSGTTQIIPAIVTVNWSGQQMNKTDAVTTTFVGTPNTLADVVKMSTWNPAQQIKRPDLGHLSEGAEADVAVLAVRKGEFGYLDVRNALHKGTQRIECELTVRAGRVVWDLNGRAGVDWKKLGTRD